MEIREAINPDITTIIKTINGWHNDEFQSYDEASTSESIYLSINNGGGSNIWVLWDDSTFAGILMGSIVPNFYNPSHLIAICTLFHVRPEHQRKQWPKKLMDAFEPWEKETGLSVNTYSIFNRKNINAIKKRGFKQVKTTLMKKVNGNGIR